VTGPLTFHDTRGISWPSGEDGYPSVTIGDASFLSVVCTGTHTGYLYGKAVFNDTLLTFVLSFTGNGPYDGVSMPDTYRLVASNGYDSGDISGSLIHLTGC
jgi:hypothetical protein